MLFKSPLVLLFTNSLVLWLSFVIFYHLVRRYVSFYSAIIFCLAFYLTPAIMFRYTVEFYEMSFAPLLILLSIYFFIKKRFEWFIVSLIGMMSVKEHLFITGFIFALYSVMERRPKQWWIVPSLIAVGWYFLTFYIY